MAGPEPARGSYFWGGLTFGAGSYFRGGGFMHTSFTRAHGHVSGVSEVSEEGAQGQVSSERSEKGAQRRVGGGVHFGGFGAWGKVGADDAHGGLALTRRTGGMRWG